MQSRLTIKTGVRLLENSSCKKTDSALTKSSVERIIAMINRVVMVTPHGTFAHKLFSKPHAVFNAGEAVKYE